MAIDSDYIDDMMREYWWSQGEAVMREMCEDEDEEEDDDGE